MADDPDKSPDPGDSSAGAAKRPRSKRRWVLKFFAWCGLMALLAAAVLSLVGYVTYKNPTRAVNLALEKFVANYRIKVGEIDLEDFGKIRIEDVTVHLPEGPAEDDPGPALFETGSIEMDYDFRELATRGKFRAIRIEKPIVRIDGARLEEAKEPGKPPEEIEIGTPVLGILGPFTDSLSVSGGKAEIRLDEMPPFTLDWNLETEALDFASEKWLTETPADVKLSNLRVGEKGDDLRIDEAAITLKFSSDFKTMEMGGLHIAEPLIRITPDTLRAFAKDTTKPPGDDSSQAGEDDSSQAGEDETTGAAAGAFSFLMKALEIERAQFELAEFESLPDVRFETSVRVEGFHFANREIEIGKGELVTLALDHLKIDGGDSDAGSAAGDHLAEIRQLKVAFFPAAFIEDQRIENVVFDHPVIHWNNRTASRFASQISEALEKSLQKPPAGSESKNESKNENATKKKGGSPLTIGALAINGGQLETRDLTAGDLPIPDIRFDTEVSLSGLQIGGTAGFRAAGPQALTIRDLRISNPEAGTDEPPLVKVDEISGQLDWDSYTECKLIEMLKIKAPDFNLTDTSLAPWLSLLNGPATETGDETANETLPVKTATPQVAGTLPPIWIVNDLAITDGDLRLDTTAFDGRIPNVKGSFEITHRPSDDPAAHPYRATIERLSVRSRAQAAPGAEAPGGAVPGDSESNTSEESGIPGQDISFIRELQIDVSSEGIQREKKIDRILIDGGLLNVGDGLDQLVNGGKAKTEETDPDAAEPEKPAAEPEAKADPPPLADADAGEEKKGWRIGKFTVTRSRVHFEALIPQIAGLEFDVETNLKDLPLSGGGMLSQNGEQKVELRGITIRYDGFFPVADLPTIFVHFTIAGLVNQRIEKIDLIAPSLYVGEPLFWWIEYQRKHRKTNEGAGVGLDGTASPLPADESGGASDWEIGEINARFGKIVISPTGYPIGVIPFPFDATTNLKNGEINLKLDIPDQDHVYHFEQLKLDLYGLNGQVQFNVPIEQESNNLVQTFNLKRAIWKNLEAEDLVMSVTFDQNIIHGDFWAKAYRGDDIDKQNIEGNFNVYLAGRLGQWDAYITGSNMNMAPITQALVPDNFLMDGKVYVELVSKGHGMDYNQTRGKIDTLNSGTINITKVGDFIEELPEDWSLAQKSSTTLALESLKNFEYDQGGGVRLFFIDLDGSIKLKLDGPSGSRIFDIYSHDLRGRKAKKNGDSEDDTKPKPAEVGALGGRPSTGADTQ